MDDANINALYAGSLRNKISYFFYSISGVELKWLTVHVDLDTTHSCHGIKGYFPKPWMLHM